MSPSLVSSTGTLFDEFSPDRPFPLQLGNLSVRRTSRISMSIVDYRYLRSTHAILKTRDILSSIFSDHLISLYPVLCPFVLSSCLVTPSTYVFLSFSLPYVRVTQPNHNSYVLTVLFSVFRVNLSSVPRVYPVKV